MSTVVESVEVHVPVSTAYNQWTQFETFPEFMGGVESITQTDDRHTHWVTKIGGVRREFDAEITEQHPDERIAWRSIAGDTTHAGLVTFEPLDAENTRVTVQLDWQPEGLTEKAGSALGLDDRQVKADTRKFKEFIEHRGTETGEWRGDVGGRAPTMSDIPESPLGGMPASGGTIAGSQPYDTAAADRRTEEERRMQERGRDAYDPDAF